MISGSPGFDNRIWLRAVTIFQRLPELLKRLDRVEKDLAKHAAHNSPAAESAPSPAVPSPAVPSIAEPDK
jgi:hypothetical protein